MPREPKQTIPQMWIDVNELKKILDRKMSEVPYNSQTSIMIGKKDAEVKLEAILKAYLTKVESKEGAILLCFTGKPENVAQAMEAMSLVDPNVIVLSGDEFYSKLVGQAVSSMNGTGQWSTHQETLILSALAEEATKMGIRQYPQPKMGNPEVIKTNPTEAAVNIARKMIQATSGDDINTIYLKNQLKEKLLAQQPDVLPILVVLGGLTSEEIPGVPKAILGGNHQLVEVDVIEKSGPDAFVAEVFAKLKKSLTSTPNKK